MATTTVNAKPGGFNAFAFGRHCTWSFAPLLGELQSNLIDNQDSLPGPHKAQDNETMDQLSQSLESSTLLDSTTSDQPTRPPSPGESMLGVQTVAAQEPIWPSAPDSPMAKRKLHSDTGSGPKKRRATGPQVEPPAVNKPQNPPPTPSSYSQAYEQVVAKLSQKFAVKTMSVMPSTSINKHVDQALVHLGRFNFLDQTVLPGVVLLCAKSNAAGKLVTISELIRRRIGESEQKWFQYNMVKEVAQEEAAPEPSVVEDTYMATGEYTEQAADDEYFEMRGPTIHEQAVQPANVKYRVHFSVLISRVPLDELNTEQNAAVQTNEQHIEDLWKKKRGLVA